MTFLEPSIFIPGYFKNYIDPIIKEKNGKLTRHNDVIEILNNEYQSERDWGMIYTLNHIMYKILIGKNRLSNFLSHFTDCDIEMSLNDYRDITLSELMNTLKSPEPQQNKKFDELKDILDINLMTYLPINKLPRMYLQRMTQHPTPDDLTIKINQTTKESTKVGCIIYVNEGFGDIMDSNDEYNKMELIESLPEYIYRYLMDNLSEEIEDRSFLSVTRLK